MDSRETRAHLSAYRVGESFGDDARFETARQMAEADPSLAKWWKEEQELDRLIGAKLEGPHVPAGLKARLLDPERPSLISRPTWPRKVALLAAAIVLLAVFFGSWRGLFQPATSLADYRDEMVSFVRLDPSLDLETAQLSQATAFLKKSGAPSEINLPPPMRGLATAGCRTLRFHGQDVALICFRGEGGELMHMFVVNRKAMTKTRSDGDGPKYSEEGEWMTAMWMDGDHAYLLASKSSREALAKYLETS